MKITVEISNALESLKVDVDATSAEKDFLERLIKKFDDVRDGDPMASWMSMEEMPYKPKMGVKRNESY